MNTRRSGESQNSVSFDIFIFPVKWTPKNFLLQLFFLSLILYQILPTDSFVYDFIDFRNKQILNVNLLI